MPNAKGFNGSFAVSPYIPLAILGLLLAIYGGVLLRYDDIAHLGMSGLFLLGAGSLLWERRRAFVFKSTWPAIFLGAIGVVLTLGISALLVQQSILFADKVAAGIDPPKWIVLLTRLLPIISGFGVAMIAFGRTCLRQVWRELGILLALGLPGIIAAYVVDISPVTARFSTALLWYAQVDVVRDGLNIFYISDNGVISGGVEVYAGCSGLESMAYLLGLSGLCLVMFPISGWKRYFTPLMGLILGFVINGVRVSLMTVLVGLGRYEAFDYWHIGDGSLLFGLLAVLAFGGFYMGIQTLDQRANRMPSLEPPENSVAEVEALSPAVLAFLEEGEGDLTRKL
ncbi:MAG: cyanoexosortase A [Cyanobacteria bacterium P01_H01_bin.58]